GRRLRHAHDCDVWTRELADGDRAVLLLNRGVTSARIGVEARELGLDGDRHAVRDLWSGEESAAGAEIDALVAPRSAAMLRVRAGAPAALRDRVTIGLSPTLFTAGLPRRVEIGGSSLPGAPDGA